jgi:hypothetical protein
MNFLGQLGLLVGGVALLDMRLVNRVYSCACIANKSRNFCRACAS